MKRLSIVTVIMMIVAFCAFRATAVEPLTQERFQKLHAHIVGAVGNEKWTEIPWKTDLWEARKVAAQEGKPIFMWAMNGHPLGCT